LVVAKVRERLAVNKQVAETFDVQKCNFRKLRELEVKEQYQIKISIRFAVLENLNDSQDINSDWDNIRENIKTSGEDSLCLHELKQKKPWCDEECLGFFRPKESG